MQKLYFGGDILTIEKENEYVEAILVEDGIIKKVGDLASVRAYCKVEVTEINLQGKTLMPGFIDPHGHFSMMADFCSMVDLNGCEDFDEIRQRLLAYIEESCIETGKPIIAFGYDHNILKENRHPDKYLLDEVSTKHPIYASHTSGHMAVANSYLLDLVEIDETTENPQGGVIGRVGNTMEPNGYLEEAGMMKAREVQETAEVDLMALCEKAQQIYLQNGITTVQDGATGKRAMKTMREFGETGKLKVDIVAYPLLQMEDGREIFEENPECKNTYYNHLKLGGYKQVLDGSPQGKSAWLTKPYEGEDEYCGYPWLKDEQVEECIRMAVEDGQQLLTHCNGDAAGDQLLKCYQKVWEESGKKDLRPVMIHCQTARYDQLDKMAELKMIPSIFVAHTYYWGDTHLKNLGEERGSMVSPTKSSLERGLCFNLHQDPPVVKPLMLHTIWCAVNRITRTGVKIGQEECIGVYDALKAVTINGAYMYMEEDTKGTIKEGKRADLVVLDNNPLKVDQLLIKDIKVLETIKDGETVFRA